jgi:hypothetical protein
VPCLNINDIYQRFSARCFPFIAKIDIEGGEEDLFSGSTEWVSVTPVLIVARLAVDQERKLAKFPSMYFSA